MVKKIMTLGLLLAVSTAVSAQVPPQSDINWQSSMIKAAAIKTGALDETDQRATKVTPANQKLKKDDDSKGVKSSSRFARMKDSFVSFVTKIYEGFCSLFGY